VAGSPLDKFSKMTKIQEVFYYTQAPCRMEGEKRESKNHFWKEDGL